MVIAMSELIPSGQRSQSTFGTIESAHRLNRKRNLILCILSIDVNLFFKLSARNVCSLAVSRVLGVIVALLSRDIQRFANLLIPWQLLDQKLIALNRFCKLHVF